MKRKHLATVLAPLCAAALLGIACDANRDAGAPDIATERSAGQEVDDKQMTGAVKEALDENIAYKFPNVEVSTYGGKVQLSGFVVTGEQKDKAEEIAEAIAGGASVENKITVKE